MPVSSAVADPYTTGPDGEPQPDSPSALYAAAIAGMLALLAAFLAPKPSVPWPSWAQQAMGRLPAFRLRIRQSLIALEATMGPIVERAMGRVVEASIASAIQDTGWAGRTPRPDPELARLLMATLRSVHLRVTVTMEDAYRSAINEALRTTSDPAVAVQRVLDDLADRGVTGFVDKAGRHWSLETYVEVATRSAYSEAALDAYLKVIATAGYGLVTVSRNPTSCPKCLPWQGKILSADGHQAGIHEVVGPNGARRTVLVAGSLDDARAAGLLHPWCRHRLAVLIPGRSVRMGSSPGGDAASKAARAERRYRSRTARAWSRRQRVALTPSAKLTAAVHAQRWRGVR